MPDEPVAEQQIDPKDARNPNLAAKWGAEDRKKIARAVCQWYQDDKLGRKDWENKRDRWYKLWLMHREPKSEPWPGCSNVCLPLLAIACNQMHSRSYQAMFNPPQVVKTMPVGENDVTRSKNVEGFMNWQVMYDMPDFEEEHDKLLLNIPISGTNFTKSCYDAENERPSVEYVSGVNVILPYRTRNLESARRICHELWLHHDELAMRNATKKGYYVDFDKVPETPSSEQTRADIENTKDEIEGEAYPTTEKPRLLLECHTWWKSNGKDLPEPYVFLVDFESETLLRATSREVKTSRHKRVLQYFTDYHFIPNPEGFYSFGFGHFLETLNEMGNTAFNQIFDAGRVSNQPFGFYGRRSGLRTKEIKLYPGKMIEVEDASQVFFPSMQRVDSVLFQVLGLIQRYTESFTSTSDYMMGREASGVKTPTAAGTQAIIEQGLIVFGVMIKRIFRSLKKELKLLYEINGLFLPEEKQYRVMEAENKIAFPKIKRADFEGTMDVIPLADPTYASRLTRRQEAQEIYGMILQNPLLGVANPQLVVKNPKAILAATREVVETYDRKNLLSVIPELPPEPMSPIAENALFMQGDSHDPMPGEDHMGHFEIHMGFTRTPFFASMPPEFKKLLMDHIDKTKSLLYAEQQTRQALGGGLPPGGMGAGAMMPPSPAPAPMGPQPGQLGAGSAGPAGGPGVPMMAGAIGNGGMANGAGI
jgi:hypothetical protein